MVIGSPLGGMTDMFEWTLVAIYDRHNIYQCFLYGCTCEIAYYCMT